VSTRPLEIPFGEWLPDLPARNNPGALIARNVIPEIASYRALNGLASFTTALASVCLGSTWARSATNTVFNFAGDADALYRLDGGTTWTNVDGPSAPYQTAAYENGGTWEFSQFGELVLATNGVAPVQKYDIGSGSAFEDLGGTPPRAKHIAAVRDFVFLGNTSGGSDTGPSYVQWSGFNNSELWTPSLSTQSDFQQLFGRGGPVQRIVPGDYATIFTDQSIWRADYAGPPVIFQIDEVETKKGTPAPNSVIWSGGRTWYYGYDDFYMFDGAVSTPMGANRIARYFERTAAPEGIVTMRGAVDRKNRLLIWAYRSESTSPINDRLIIYNWAADRWAEAVLDTQVLEEFVSAGATIDSLPLLLDDNPILLDSNSFVGGELALQAFDSSNRTASFGGMPLQAVIDTKEVAGPGHERITTNGGRPLVEGDASTVVTVQSGTRNSLQEDVTFAAARSLNGINGEANFRANARYHRFRLNIDGGFSHASGFKTNVRQDGRR
jgi:hypothetical protein